MTAQTRRKPSVPAPAPQRTAATHASRAHGFSFYRSFIVSTDTISRQCPDSSRRARQVCLFTKGAMTDRSYVGPRGLTSGGFLNHEEKETRR